MIARMCSRPWRKQQILFGNDRQKSKVKNNCKYSSKNEGSRRSFDCVGRKVRVQLRSR